MESQLAQRQHRQETRVDYYNRIRHGSELLCEQLELEDFGIQTMPEVSPPKWHLAHTSWFFETLLLKPYFKRYKEFNSHFSVLFNSYYDTIGNYHPRDQRGLLSRPTVREVYAYRQYVDNAMIELLSQSEHPDFHEIQSRTVLGLNHEQQHQELLLTDIKHIFASNPLRPVYKNKHAIKKVEPVTSAHSDIQWIEINGGVKNIGFTGVGFCYDNETPQHKTYIDNFKLASRPVTNGEYLKFITAGGYQQASLWLSDAWKIINEQQWQAPLYWEINNKTWWYMTLSGMQVVDENAPVCHVSYFEAAAYSRWFSQQQKGVRLPTEAEWEIAASTVSVTGHFRESDVLQPQTIQSLNSKNNSALQQMFGDVWEWTQSAYAAYPGYHAATGPLGEYNGKFMSSQIVLRGGSCITPLDHIRTTYRNFFYPHERWQFSGFRLAKDIL